MRWAQRWLRIKAKVMRWAAAARSHQTTFCSSDGDFASSTSASLQAQYLAGKARKEIELDSAALAARAADALEQAAWLSLVTRLPS